jgi:hypothetical protein
MASDGRSEGVSSIPVVLDFIPTSCSIRLHQNSEGSVPSLIRMGLRLSEGQEVSTTDKRSLNDIEWSIEIFEGENSDERLQSQSAIGMAHYFPATIGDDYTVEEGCSVWAYFAKEPFALLSTFVLSGRMPSVLRVHAKGGLRYGWAGDGSEKIWDVASNDHASVEQVQVSMSLVQNPAEDEFASNTHRPVTDESLERLERSLAASIRKANEAVAVRLGWLLAVVTLAAAILIFR